MVSLELERGRLAVVPSRIARRTDRVDAWVGAVKPIQSEIRSVAHDLANCAQPKAEKLPMFFYRQDRSATLSQENPA